ncbi:MAG: hypothetical protein H6799_02025 [Candidatus Nomurabacteria bacterium]|nr:MAG: hypothetical protein H6799_02025 [Candidatus Nomurabacteria bacterium]HRV76058.1 hypothetical protein [Candidatus Saccharimonadales bacterium]
MLNLGSVNPIDHQTQVVESRSRLRGAFIVSTLVGTALSLMSAKFLGAEDSVTAVLSSYTITSSVAAASSALSFGAQNRELERIIELSNSVYHNNRNLV